MSFYLRKSIKAGPFRLNLSKSGIGISAGVPGFRVGKGPRGTYVHMGRGGVYYRQTLSSPRRESQTSRVTKPTFELPANDVLMEDVTGATPLEMAAASSSDLVEDMNMAASRITLMPIVVLLFLPILTIPLALWLRALNKTRRTVVAFYDVNDEHAEHFQRIVDAFDEVVRSQRQWYITAEGAVRTTQQFKTHAGAASLLKRAPGKASIEGPPLLASNIAIPSLHGGKRSLYFLPDRVVVRDGRTYADVEYSELKVSGEGTNFIEVGRCPNDANQVGTTWQYVNKSGGPDRRYKNNRQLPIMRYGELDLRSSSGLHFIWQTSRAEAVATFAAALERRV
jgi:hypothetical protein